ncbi:MAG: EAL domain-containing protein [Pseudomonas sp.]|uniref:bifunctional diguanylate cyclase/phosphodiesterase n=1 Tax=Pseudomonas sp. TaxID=306 RepID=UPI003390C459
MPHEPPFSPRVGATFTRRTLLAISALLLMAFLVTAAALVQIAHRQNTQAQQQSRFFAEKAVAARQDSLLRSIGDYAYWGDAYQHLHAQVDLEWAFTRQNLGPTLYEDFQYDGIFVIAPDGQTRYAVIESELRTLDAHQWLQGDLDALVRQAQQGSEDEQSSAAIFQVNGQPALVAAAAFTTGSDPQVRALPGPPSVLLFVDVLTPEKLLNLGQDYALERLRLAPQALDSADDPSLQLDSQPAQWLRWDAPRPGQQLLDVLLPLLALAGLVFALLTGLIMRNAMATARLMESGYRHLEDSQAALASSEARFRDVAEATSDWLWETDAEQRLVYLSERFQTVTGHPPEAWLGQRLDTLLSCDSQSLATWIDSRPPQNLLRNTLRCRYTALNAEQHICSVALRRIEGPGGVLGYRGTASDITEEVQAQAHIEHLSLHDALTGLPNRNRMQEFLEGTLQALPSRSHPVVMLSIDLDGFKQVNDAFGHAAGDQVLSEVSLRLRQCLRDEDLVARQGGDEFILVLTGIATQDDVERLCARLIECLEQPFRLDNQEVFISASIGIAMAPNDAVQANELLRYADIALYQAKNDGRGTWRFYAHEMNERIHERRLLENDLRQALAGAELCLHYQPRYHIDGQRIAGAEALVRWQHPQRGLLSPEVFIGLAEDTGLIVPLGAWVLREACAAAQAWAQPILVSVNLSPVQFSRGRLVDLVQEVLRETGLAASRLELEITESVMLNDAEGALLTLKALKTLGVRLSMDDFGTGYSSLSYLRAYPFDGLKIDRSFIAALDGAQHSHAIVQAIVGLGKALAMTVTAEGVETAEQLALLRDEGCDEVQGYYLSRPLALEHLTALLEAGSATN